MQDTRLVSAPRRSLIGSLQPRHAADYRALFWAFVLFPLPAVAGSVSPVLALWLLPLTSYLAYCTGVLTHNHIHHPVFANRTENTLYGAWLSVFYGCPVACWIPTHVLNHHRYHNGERDVTRTERRSEAHSLRHALAYTASCAAWQLPSIANYVRRARSRGGRAWTDLRVQTAALALSHALVLAINVHAHGTWLGLASYGLSLGLPALVAPGLMFFTNYLQHVHCDPESADDHSRNFTSPIANWFVFDNGYHTVHHEKPGVHWSHYAALHRERAPRLDPGLNCPSVLGFMLENYLLRLFDRRLGTKRAWADKGAESVAAAAPAGKPHAALGEPLLDQANGQECHLTVPGG
jgi:beta-carotene hydroxylase